MKKNNMWIPLLTSVSIGAATYYSMTKKEQKLGQVVKNFLPFISSHFMSSPMKKK